MKFDHLQFLLLISLCFLFLTLIHDVQETPFPTMQESHLQNIQTFKCNKIRSYKKISWTYKLPPADDLFQSNYILNEEESDELYLGCDEELPNSPHKLAVVKPIIHKNMHALLQSIGYWEMEEIVPCYSNDNLPVDLIFWFHQDLSCNPSVIESIEKMLKSVPKARRCFSNVYFLSANIPSELDYYGDGTILMFYKLLRNQFIQENYNYIFFMESDVWPTQSNWISALWYHTQTVESFWMKGGIIRTKDFLARGWGPDYHINGNSLYKTNNTCFLNFLRRVQESYPHKPYDMAIRLDESRFVEQQRFMHKFVYSDLLQNHGDGVSNFSRRFVTHKSPNCYFVHSKEPLAEEYTIHPIVATALADVLPFAETCSSRKEPLLEAWEKNLYNASLSSYWKSIYKNSQ